MRSFLRATSLSLIVVLFVCGIAPKALPPLNKKIVAYVKTVIGKKVDRGECWDLANQALTRSGAKWQGGYQYGKLLNHKKEKVLPGDIIQFANVKIKYTKGNSTFMESYPHHTAIVYEKVNDHTFKIAHQNNGFSGRKVSVSTLDFETITKGKLKIYRPIQ